MADVKLLEGTPDSVKTSILLGIAASIAGFTCGFGIDKGSCTSWISKDKLVQGVNYGVDFQSDAIADNKESRMKALFGSWIESGDEDMQVEELYKSRLTPSSLENE